MKVDIYFNLHKKMLSVRSRERADYGKIIKYSECEGIENVSFVVNKAGRDRVLREKRKNVHAFARGRLSSDVPIGAERIRWVVYNPYLHNSFVVQGLGTRVRRADFAIVIGKKILAFNPT